MKRQILFAFYVTLFVFFALFGLSKLTTINLFNAFDPVSQALKEFELTDYVFSKLRPNPLPDDRIVLVNIGYNNRRMMAEQIRIISQHNPRVIGIDSFFNCEGGYYDTLSCPQLLDTLGNLILSNAIAEAGNVVLVSRLLQSDSLYNVIRFDTLNKIKNKIDVYDSIEYSDAMFSDFAHNAYANLPTNATYQEDVKVCKSIIPSMKVKGKKELAFSVQIAMLYDSIKTKRFLERGKYEEVINFRGNFEVPDVRVKSLRDNMSATSEYRTLCYAIDWPNLLNGDYLPAMFENSVVIMGFLGETFGDEAWEDKFFTPLNTKVAGRANPDMFGPVVHANVVAMILNEDYVDELQEWHKYLIAFVVCFFNVFLFTWVDRRLPVWFDALSVVLQLAQIILVSSLVVMVFAAYSFKMDLTLTIGILALVGPCFDIVKSLEKTLYEVLPMEQSEH